MMKNDEFVLNRHLFNCKGTHLSRWFESLSYPWEIISGIKEIITEKINQKMDGYAFLSDDILIGENVEISKFSSIEGPAIIGHNTQIRPGAYIRGNVIIGQNCVIGNSTEIKNSLLLDFVQAPHYNYIGDSLLGNKVHLGAGVICSNLKTDKSNVKVDGFDTGMRKLGAMLGDGTDIGCGCVLNPGTVIGMNTTAYPLNSLRGVYHPNMIIKSKDEIVERRMF